MWELFVPPQNNNNSNISYHWSQITLKNIIIMKTFEILKELWKCYTDMKWANAVGKMAPIDLFNLAGLPQTFNL